MKEYLILNAVAIFFLAGFFFIDIFDKKKTDVEKLCPIDFFEKQWNFILTISLVMAIYTFINCFQNLFYIIGLIFWLNISIGFIIFRAHYTALEERNKDNYVRHKITASQAEKPKYSLIFFWFINVLFSLFKKVWAIIKIDLNIHYGFFSKK